MVDPVSDCFEIVDQSQALNAQRVRQFRACYLPWQVGHLDRFAIDAMSHRTGHGEAGGGNRATTFARTELGDHFGKSGVTRAVVTLLREHAHRTLLALCEHQPCRGATDVTCQKPLLFPRPTVSVHTST